MGVASLSRQYSTPKNDVVLVVDGAVLRITGVHSHLLHDLGFVMVLQWRHYEHDGVSNHQPHDCLLKRFFRRRSKKTSKLRVTGLCEGNSPVTGEFPAQMASNAENVFIWWRHHDRARLWPSQELQMTWQRCWAISRHRADWSYRDFIEVSLVVNDFKDISQIRRQFSKWPIRPCEISR